MFTAHERITVSSSTYARVQNIKQIFYATPNNLLPDDGPVRAEIYRSLVPLNMLLQM